MNRALLVECLSEAFGTFVLVLLGTASVAMVVLFGTGAAGEIVHGGYTNITISWGLAVTFAVYLTARISGAHLNPAVTLALAAFRGFPWSKVLPYSLAQTVGAFAAAALTFLVYRPAFLKFDPSLSRTAGVFATFPAFPEVPAAGLLDQVVGTFVLLLLIFALGDDRNLPPASNLGPVLVGLTVVVIGMTFGGMHGYAINPARDFGPRLFTVLAGFQNNGLTDGSNIFLVPIVGPLVGGLLGGLAYDGVIRRHLPRRPDEIPS
jgi:glycerol uptake facilitator protein